MTQTGHDAVCVQQQASPRPQPRLRVQLHPWSDAPPLAKNRVTVASTASFGTLMVVVRRRLKLQAQDALFFFVGDKTLVAPQALLTDLHAQHAVDGVLHVQYSRENCFGAT